jgi:hypothetical protein
MTELLTVVAILSGLIAFGFGLAGILGLVDLELTEERRHAICFDRVSAWIPGGQGVGLGA